MHFDAEPLTIGLINLIAGLLALIIAYVYTLPWAGADIQDPAPVVLIAR